MHGILRKTEWGVALLITAISVCLHLEFFQHAGGLWRDEVGSINLASRPGLSGVWDYLFFDSFPAFWVMVVRAWMWLGLGSDGGLRLLGLLTGLSVLGVLWFNARRLKIAFPFFSLLLLGLSPTIFIWGDSMRAWGWGIIWILLTFGMIWKVVELPTRWNVVLATLAAIGSVHSTYYNWVLLLSLCVAGAVVTLRQREWKRGIAVMGIGFVAGLTVIPYLIGIHRVGDHYLITQSPYNLEKFISRIREALSSGGPDALYVWCFLLVAAPLLVVFTQLRPAALKATPAQKDLLLFSMTALVIGAVGYFFFLRNLKFGTQPWYYSALMTLAAITFDTVFSVLGNWENGRKLRLLVVAIVVALLAPLSWQAAGVRLTNMDLIVKKLNETAGKNDLIVVNPWYCGISFKYYYTGQTPWVTLPEIKDHSYHHYEPMVQHMINPDQMNVVQGVLDQIAQTLKAGHRVWLVGDLSYPPPGQKPQPLPPAPNSPAGWRSASYQQLWSLEAGYFVQLHTGHYENFIVSPPDRRVNAMEFMPLAVVEGWHD